MALDSGDKRSATSAMDRAQAAWIRCTTPRADDLPNMVVLLWFPCVVILAVIVLSALSLSGTSSGEWIHRLGLQEDPHLLAGTSRPIRSDEWYAQSSWVVSQVSQGFPTTNAVFPGGMDATVFNDLPTKDWSTAFRPHLWALMLFPLDQGMAARWWVPAALALIGVYCFVVTILPRAVVLGVLLALALIWQPIVQWWWLPVTLLPLAFSFIAMTAVVWSLKSRRRRSTIVWSVVAGYLTVTMVMSIYAPFIVGALLAATTVSLGFVIQTARSKELSIRDIARRMLPLAVAAVGAAVVAAAWVVTRRDTVSAVLGTVYPGQRSLPPGQEGRADLVVLLSAPFQRSLQTPMDWGLAGGNESENSAPLMLSLFLAVPMLWWLVTSWRRHRRLDWVVLGVLTLQAVVVAYFFVPGWQPLAKVLLLNRSSPARLRTLFAIMAVVSVVVLADRLRTSGRRAPWVVALLAGASAVVPTAFVWHELDASGSPLASSTTAWGITVLLAVAVLSIARRYVLVGGTLFLVCSAVIGAGVNPLYRGVVDLRNDSAAGRAVQQMADDDPDAAWVGVGSVLSIATLVETGTRGYSGVQTYPPELMWDQIDPEHRYEKVWNRLAHLFWQPGSGPPNPRSPFVDQVHLTFDPCADFAQTYVTYVLVDGPALDGTCVTEVARFATSDVQQWIYRVDRTASPAAAG
jgi:hypothetical protein